MIGLIMSRVYKDNLSAVCSELARQGRLPLGVYVADTQFGARIARENPAALKVGS
jgi:hypothetical protein